MAESKLSVDHTLRQHFARENEFSVFDLLAGVIFFRTVNALV